MSNPRLPRRLERSRRRNPARCCPAHRAWVRHHRCSVTNCEQLPIECSHVRKGTDGGQGLKPSDRWTVSLCREHHAEQHRIGERAFEKRHGLDLYALAQEFAKKSPHSSKLLRDPTTSWALTVTCMEPSGK
ncbi:DUF968 domain-containing protein [Altererythrobacter sp. SALINAS58]|uniref:DUF968 domain-containing protein n=1 Tax=Alteripontixanthobacter muriae TaxID=2705546 RepID=UPI00157719DB|nr:putative HNHc nuclease [Alteripontixanthobacter muriae]NTZ42131.1 DUF968 domain-containing protein [Alteripontixanthobacter muriae]